MYVEGVPGGMARWTLGEAQMTYQIPALRRDALAYLAWETRDRWMARKLLRRTPRLSDGRYDLARNPIALRCRTKVQADQMAARIREAIAHVEGQLGRNLGAGHMLQARRAR